MPVIVIEQVSGPTQDVRSLVDELETELSAHYSDEQRHGVDIEALFQPDVLFFVARSDGNAVGCGGVAFLADFAELKRMFVRPQARGRGIGSALLARLETAARARASTLRLETGVQQHQAIRLYARHGFERCAPFAPYTALTPSAIATSIFFEKSLTTLRT